MNCSKVRYSEKDHRVMIKSDFGNKTGGYGFFFYQNDSPNTYLESFSFSQSVGLKFLFNYDPNYD